MTMKRLATVLAALGGVFIIYIGLSYLIAPGSTAPDFGLPTWPEHDGKAFLAVKGVRDVGTGLVVLALLLTGQRRALGWAMLAITFVPAGDMVVVLGNDGSTGAALGVHGATAAVVAVTAALLLRERTSAGARALAGTP
jgi:hypothetical protein